jgi:hypothetical protein
VRRLGCLRPAIDEIAGALGNLNQERDWPLLRVLIDMIGMARCAPPAASPFKNPFTSH